MELEINTLIFIEILIDAEAPIPPGSNRGKFLDDQTTYNTVRGYIIAVQKQVYAAVNSAMVTAYWNIGKQIYEACGENDRAAYGKQLLQYLSEKLTALYVLYVYTNFFTKTSLSYHIPG